MSAKFSPTLRLTDLNDFIAPTQECIITGRKPNIEKPERNQGKLSGGFNNTSSPAEAVKISLKDCLACSGCITSAETVMLERQSLDEFLSQLNSDKTVIVSLSPQSRASLASHFDLSPAQVFGKLTAMFKSIGVKAVYDTSCSRDLSLIEVCNEFISRYREYQLNIGKVNGQALPMVSSACPGWICYAEKTLGSYILPHISSVKSPQQVMGAAIKHHLSQKIGLPPDKVYHVTVMPCYDKKLEAAREDFVFSMDGEGENIRDASVVKITEVDSVLTSGEVLDLIHSKSIDFKGLAEAPLDKLLTNVDEEGHLYGVSGGAGGYAETVFRYAAKTLFGIDLEGPLNFKTVRNSDFREVILEVEGTAVLKVALCYGFRNLQNIVRKIKIGKCDYHFLEVMACPSGCLNGGGQIKPEAGQSAKDLIQQLEDVYMQDVSIANPFLNPIVKRLYDEWLEEPGSEKAKRYIHTEYHPLVKSIASELHNW
ncbi:Fe-only hydrogenase protein [Dioscorea alata]|uniref:Fe-only hydrogenase protein n=2 Tax=Dioscorea alata TaxID=55571 RepID=A0ACB7UMA3_DIOAL|nr:Fe-only hydrogenase protein [Dioscorea alata]KAH7661558.1 Fe-only hydrogenase protein [Dioscorea alata]